MKTSKYIMAALVGGLTLLSACDSMEDTYQNFLEGGEIVYRAKVKSLVAEPGRNRVKLSWNLEYPTHVVRCEVREGEQVLATLPVEYNDLVELECNLTNLEEKTYTLSVFSFDESGNSSVKTDVIVEVYGDRYATTLSSERSIESVLKEAGDPSKVLVNLSPVSSSKLVGTILHYKSTSGVDKSVRLLPEENMIVLTDVADGSYYNLQDLWKPVITAIDEFESPMREYTSDKIPNGFARLFGTAYRKGNDVYVVLSKAASSVVRTIIQFGEEKVEVLPGVNSVTLPNVAENTMITMSTIVTVGATGTEYLTPMQSMNTSGLLTKLAMSNWKAVDKSSDIADGASGYVRYAIDDDLSTFWHTQYSPTTPAYPHYMTVDMGEVNEMSGIAVARRDGNNNIAAKMKLEVSDDNSTWTVAGEFSPNNSIDGLQLFKLKQPITGRYFKLTGLVSSTSNVFMCISEVNLFK